MKSDERGVLVRKTEESLFMPCGKKPVQQLDTSTAQRNVYVPHLNIVYFLGTQLVLRRAITVDARARCCNTLAATACGRSSLVHVARALHRALSR